MHPDCFRDQLCANLKKQSTHHHPQIHSLGPFHSRHLTRSKPSGHSHNPHGGNQCTPSTSLRTRRKQTRDTRKLRMTPTHWCLFTDGSGIDGHIVRSYRILPPNVRNEAFFPWKQQTIQHLHCRTKCHRPCNRHCRSNNCNIHEMQDTRRQPSCDQSNSKTREKIRPKHPMHNSQQDAETRHQNRHCHRNCLDPWTHSYQA